MDAFSRQHVRRFLQEHAPRAPKRATQPRMTPAQRSLRLRERARQRLTDSRFRALNRRLGEESSAAAAHTLSSSALFRQYHEGYARAMSKWPERPIDHVVRLLEEWSKQEADLVVADVGCGPEPLLQQAFPRLQVHSFDLVAEHAAVTRADMTSLPLAARSVDVCVFCLSLMATDVTRALREARRVLKARARLVVAEVSSRFDSLDQFTRQMREMGFQTERVTRVSRDFFTLLEFRKVARRGRKWPEVRLKPANYAAVSCV